MTIYVIYWRKSGESEEYEYKGAYNLRLMELLEFGYEDGEDFTTFTETIPHC